MWPLMTSHKPNYRYSPANRTPIFSLQEELRRPRYVDLGGMTARCPAQVFSAVSVIVVACMKDAHALWGAFETRRTRVPKWTRERGRVYSWSLAHRIRRSVWPTTLQQAAEDHRGQVFAVLLNVLSVGPEGRSQRKSQAKPALAKIYEPDRGSWHALPKRLP